MNHLQRLEEIKKNLANIFSKSHKLWDITLKVKGTEKNMRDIREEIDINHENMDFILNSKLLIDLSYDLERRSAQSFFYERERIQELNRINDILDQLIAQQSEDKKKAKDKDTDTDFESEQEVD